MSELFNDGGISYVAAALFTGLFGFLGIIANNLFKARSEIRQAQDVTEEVKEQTEPVSNGFIERVDKNFETLIANQDRTENSVEQLQQVVQSHLTWHLNQHERGKDNATTQVGQQQEQRNRQ